MFNMDSIQDVFQYLKEKSFLSSILIADIIAVFFFILNPICLIISGDLDIIFALLVGILVYLKLLENREKIFQKLLALNATASALISISLTVIVTAFSLMETTNGFFLIFLIFLFMSQVLGLFLACIAGIIFKMKSEEKEGI